MMKIGLDIDGTISENSAFFATLAKSPDFEIYIITGRDQSDHKETLDELRRYDIQHKGVYYADNWEDKGRLCKDLGVKIMFDDQDEYIHHIPLDILVMKPRNGGNWNEKKDTWLVKPISTCAASRCEHGLSSARVCEKCQGPNGHNQQCECKRCLGDDWKP
jgi:hypothetical protein